MLPISRTAIWTIQQWPYRIPLGSPTLLEIEYISDAKHSVSPLNLLLQILFLGCSKVRSEFRKRENSLANKERYNWNFGSEKEQYYLYNLYGKSLVYSNWIPDECLEYIDLWVQSIISSLNTVYKAK